MIRKEGTIALLVYAHVKRNEHKVEKPKTVKQLNCLYLILTAFSMEQRLLVETQYPKDTMILEFMWLPSREYVRGSPLDIPTLPLALNNLLYSQYSTICKQRCLKLVCSFV